MKLLIKKTLLLTALIFTCFMAFSQSKQEEWPVKNEVFDGYNMVDTNHATPQQMHRVHRRQKAQLLTKDHYYYSFSPLRHLGIRFKKTSSMVSEIYQGLNWGPDNEFKSILIEGDCAIEIAALDIVERNVNDYRFRVVENDTKEIVSWAKPSAFKYIADGKAKYAYLGLYPSNAPNDRELKIELYRNSVLVDALIVGWGMVEPAIIGGNIQYKSKLAPLPDNGLHSRWLEDKEEKTEVVEKIVNGQRVEIMRPRPVKDFIETKSLNDIKFRADDSVQMIHFDLLRNSSLYNYKIVLTRDADGQRDTINLGEINSQFDLYKEFWKTPGKYKVTFIPKLHKPGGRPVKLFYSSATDIKFTVLPPLDYKYSLPIKTVGLIILGILTIGGIVFIQYRSTQKRRLALEEQNKQIAMLQLQSVRSQLNPHFIFNALAGIQNLINKNEVENANKYLTRFARLTRNVLDDGQKELTSIAHEVDLLTDYLQMEQMRFGFKFNIDVGENLDQQIEIPAMLLQPFVENAVKHGVSALKGGGLITVTISQNNNDIILTVSDNGGGFSENPTPGIGIKLCDERIKLLNSIYKNTGILLHTNSTDNGATITIQLKNWL